MADNVTRAIAGALGQDTAAKVAEISGRLAALENRQAELLAALNRSLAIESLWPGVFKIPGAAKVRSMWTRLDRAGLFTITAPDGSQRVFAWQAVPDGLHNPQVDSELENAARRHGCHPKDYGRAIARASAELWEKRGHLAAAQARAADSL